jgi:hypothetical protein
MSFATTRYFHTMTTRVPVLTPLYGAHHAAFRAMDDGCYECGSSEKSDFLLNFNGAKPSHCRFRREAGIFFVNRLDGRVWVNDLPVSGMSELSEGDIVSFGPVSFRLNFHDVSTSFHDSADEHFTSPRIPAPAAHQSGARPTHFSQQLPASAPASPVQDAPVSTALVNELQEHQRLLAMRQQQLEELTQIIRERERQADSRLAAIEERAGQLTAQSDDLTSLREFLSLREREVVQRSEEADHQCQLLAEQQRELASVAEQNFLSVTAAEKAREEMARQEAELQVVREQTLREKADLESMKSELLQQREQADRQRELLAEQQRELAAVTEQNSRAVTSAEKAREELARQEAELQTLREQTLAEQTDLESRRSELQQQREQVDRQRELLAEQQRELAAVTEQNSCSATAAEKAREELARQEAELRTLQEHTLSAHTDLENRTSGIQLLRAENDAREALLNTREQELSAKAEALMLQEADLAGRLQTLLESEQRSAAQAPADTETRSVEQLAAIAAQREAATRERQNAMAAQEELRKREKSIDDRQLHLLEWQAEIESRANELSQRLIELKLYHREQRAAQAAETKAKTGLACAATLEQQLAAIQSEREELERRATEAAAREESLSEKQHAANSVLQAAEAERTALQNANKDLLCERNALSQLRQDLASRESGIAEREVLVAHQLEDLRSRFAVLDLRAAEQKQYESEIDSRAADVHRRVQQLKSDRLAFRENSLTEHSSETANVTAAEELAAVRQELDKLLLDLKSREDERVILVAERDSLLSAVRELQTALQDAREDIAEANRLKHEAAVFEQRLEQAYQNCEERSQLLQTSDSKLVILNEQLEALQTELAASQQERDELLTILAAKAESSVTELIPLKAGADTKATFDTFSRELDQRAELLDRRDLEVSERLRKLEQSENDIESQRRQLLEARQQLEQARAEIQVAMRLRAEPEARSSSAFHEDPVNSAKSFESRSDSSPSRDADPDGYLDPLAVKTAVSGPATLLRSELAGLFGLPREPAEPLVPVPPSRFDDMDLSEPTGGNKSIVFHFGADTPKLTETDKYPAGERDTKPAREENSDEFVREYMEQLLSRGRKNAGSVLPGELKAAESKNEPAAAPAAKPPSEPVKKSGPKVKSFIEQYMAGNMGSLESGEPLRTTEPVVHVPLVDTYVEPPVALPRQKMDLQKLKENMDSFRTLSTQSVENALASHAIKMEREGFTGRFAFAAILMTMTLVLGIANARGAIDSPMLTWVTLTSAIALVSELYRRYTNIKVHTKNPLDLLFSTEESKNMLLTSTDMVHAAVPVSANPATPELTTNDVVEISGADLLDQGDSGEQQPWLLETQA